MTDNLSPEDRRKNMRAIRSTNTKLEGQVTKELWRRGIRFRKNVKGLFGKPDIAIKKYKIVIFIDSCFWHGCEYHGNMPKSNPEYWLKKLTRNKERDIEVANYYSNKGWYILRIWQHEIKEDFNEAIKKIIDFIESSKVNKKRSLM
jgi:DNA mismatch endonuclease (patch repair protein)